MDTDDSADFWRQWDVQVLNFSLVTILNILATIFLAAMSQIFDFTRIVDVANWSFADIYLFLGPVLASALTLVLVDSSTWLVNYDFGISNEMLIYWGVIGLTAVFQIVGNGSSVLLLAVYALVAFLTLAGVALLPLTALSNPLSLLVCVLIIIIFVVPTFLNVSGLFLFGSFLVLSVSLAFDSLYVLITEPEIFLNVLGDLYDHGLASGILADFEDTLEANLGTGFVHLFGTEMLQEIFDDFWLHVSMQVLVVVPLTILIAFGKIIFEIGVILGVWVFWLPVASQYQNDLLLQVAGAILFYFGFTDRLLLSSFIDYAMIQLFFDGMLTLQVWYAEIGVRALVNSFFDVESFYWGIYFLVRLYNRWTSGEFYPSRAQPEVGANTLDDLASIFTLDIIELNDLVALRIIDKYLIVGILLPVVQALTWSFQIPFFKDMSYHIRGLPIV